MRGKLGSVISGEMQMENEDEPSYRAKVTLVLTKRCPCGRDRHEVKQADGWSTSEIVWERHR